MPGKQASVAERLWRSVDIRGPDECWPWKLSTNPWGYGQINVGGKPKPTHRVAWWVTHGEWPSEQVDHRCHDEKCTEPVPCSHRRCCNPSHLSDVPAKINKARGNSPNAINARKTHCKRGHEFNEENTRRRGSFRSCRICDRIAAARSNAANKKR